jgi:hypothetical protein
MRTLADIQGCTCRWETRGNRLVEHCSCPVHAAAADAPSATHELLTRYGLRVPPAGKKYPVADLDEHLENVPVQERLLVKSELARRGWL